MEGRHSAEPKIEVKSEPECLITVPGHHHDLDDLDALDDISQDNQGISKVTSGPSSVPVPVTIHGSPTTRVVPSDTPTTSPATSIPDTYTTAQYSPLASDSHTGASGLPGHYLQSLGRVTSTNPAIPPTSHDPTDLTTPFTYFTSATTWATPPTTPHTPEDLAILDLSSDSDSGSTPGSNSVRCRQYRERRKEQLQYWEQELARLQEGNRRLTKHHHRMSARVDAVKGFYLRQLTDARFKCKKEHEELEA